jgi:hypothetical protein
MVHGVKFDGTTASNRLPQADGSYIVAPYSPTDNLKKVFSEMVLLQNGINISVEI